MFQSTIYLNAAEHVALKKMATENGTSINYILRTAVRAYFGLPVAQLKHPDKPRESKVV